jgi:hypothetical protein
MNLSTFYLVVIAACTLCAASLHCHAQAGGTAMPFLIISPNAEANGMGETSVAVMTDDPLALITNPAHLGMQLLDNRFSFGYNHSKWLPGFGIPDLYYRSYGINGGLQLHEYITMKPRFAVGLGYSRVYLNLGDYVRLDPWTNEPIGTFKPHESADHYTFSAGFEYRIKAAVGITFKHIESSLWPLSVNDPTSRGAIQVKGYDIGFLLSVPVFTLVSDFRSEPVRLTDTLIPFFDINWGLAYNNLGSGEALYFLFSEPDPLPRYVRIGTGFDVGVKYVRNGEMLQPAAFRWSREANDILVSWAPTRFDSTGEIISWPHWTYRTGLGDIAYFNDVILGRDNTEIIRKSGWEVSMFEILCVRGGRFFEADHIGGRQFSTSGFSIRSGGIGKLLKAYYSIVDVPNSVWYLIHHLDIRYSYSKITTDERSHPLDNTKFHAVNLLLYK